MREGSQVTRCHCFPHHGHYSVGEHSFNMGLLLEVLYPSDFLGNEKARLQRAILYHDLHERWTGDSPAAIKRLFPLLKATDASVFIKKETGIGMPVLNGYQTDWLKALDNIEFLLWCDDQIALGSKVAEAKRIEVMDWIDANQDSIPSECMDFLNKYGASGGWRRTPDDLS